MQVSIKLLIILISTTVLHSKINFGSVIIDEITSIYDGDTFKVNIKSYPDLLGKRVPIRVNGIDTPEIKAKCKKEKVLARKAKQMTVAMLRNAKLIELRNMKRGKYFRLIADVYADEKSLGDYLINKGLAVRYKGGKKVKDWCK